MNPRFSIVIPLYNSEKYIEETLSSLVNQTLQDFEVIIIDDASNDNSLVLAQRFLKDHSMKGIAIPRTPSVYPKGVSGCRNEGIDKSNGEWICFLDSDDLFHPHKLEILQSEIDKVKDKNVKAIYHTPMDFNDGDPIIFVPFTGDVKTTSSDISKELLALNLIYTSAVAIQKSAFGELKFDYELHGIEDYYMWLNISKKTEWMHIAFPLTAYRVRQSSLMGGRKMSYYVTQNSNLIVKIRNNPSFSKQETAIVNNYLMVEVMHYYAVISLNNYGWGDFINGIILLMKKGELLSASRLLSKHVKFRFLKIGSDIIKGK